MQSKYIRVGQVDGDDDGDGDDDDGDGDGDDDDDGGQVDDARGAY